MRNICPLWIGIFLGLMGAMVSACSHYPVNASLEGSDPQSSYRYENLSHDGNSDEIFVCLTFSGGGGRAAALSYGVLQQLRDTEITVNGERRRLLDEVDVISAVSGGSFAAAYYALHRDDIFENYEEDFLFQSYQRKIMLTALNPFQWPRYMSRHFSLTDRAAEVYDRGLFHGATYADLARGSRPYIILNATDITLDQPFQFTQNQFDYLGSDLGSVPLARAVTASSAVPVLLSPLTLRSYHTEDEPPLPDWIMQTHEERDDHSLDWQQADQLLFYRDPERCQYIHLVDGGIADNLGLRPLFQPEGDHPSPLSVGDLIDWDRVKHIVLIAVNATNRPARDWTLRSRPPGSISLLNRVIAGLMTSTTSAHARELRGILEEDERENGYEITAAVVSFRYIPDTETRRSYENIQTTLDLSPEIYERLITAGARLLAGNPEYQSLVDSLGGTITPTQFSFD